MASPLSSIRPTSSFFPVLVSTSAASSSVMFMYSSKPIICPSMHIRVSSYSHIFTRFLLYNMYVWEMERAGNRGGELGKDIKRNFSPTQNKCFLVQLYDARYTFRSTQPNKTTRPNPYFTMRLVSTNRWTIAPSPHRLPHSSQQHNSHLPDRL